MSGAAIEVVLACPCMTKDASRVDWIPGEYDTITPEEASARLAAHLATHERKEATDAV